MSPLWDDFPPGSKEYRRKYEMWSASLSQETYTVAEARRVLRMGKDRMNNLLDSGDLYHEKAGRERGILIPKAAIIRYGIGPPPGEKLFERKGE
jgi:hypothetical protein